MTFKICLVLCVLFSVYATLKAMADDVEETRATQLKRVYSLEGHCQNNTCENFYFPNESEVAFFDLKAKVHITEESTYDIIDPVEYGVLNFKNSTFAHFPLHLFYSIGVRELNIRNCSVETITWENFLMASDLKILLLSDNKIKSIGEMTFNYAPELQFLFLDNNRIRTLVSESFKGLSKLLYLDMSGNRLKELPEGVFDPLPSLQHLKLAQNRLHVIGNDLFLNNPSLLTITISENKLKQFGENALKAQQGMIILDISNNPRLEILVTYLQAKYLTATNCSLYRINIYGSVVNVDLGNNQISELYFSEPAALENLNLRNNALEQIVSLTRATNLENLVLADNPGLGGLPDSWTVDSLRSLDLSNISLTELPIASLSELPNLRHLNVSHNKLRQINPRDFKYLDKVTHFYIDNNDWNCFNLNLLMDLLIHPRGIIYTREEVDPDFPGEYINGIACMYRLEESVEVTSEAENREVVVKSEDLKSDASNEIDELRKELKVIVGHFEDKFTRAVDMINDLNVRLSKFERINQTLWDQITIST